MKKLILILTLLLSSYLANATHIFGGEMRYECTSTGIYDVYATLYHECETSIPLSSIEFLFNTTCNPSSCANLGQPSFVTSSVIEIGCLNDCDNPTYPSIKKSIFKMTVNLSSMNCTNAKIWVIAEDRSSTPNTNFSGTAKYKNYILINNNYCNNSPVFSQEVLVKSCVNDVASFDNSYTDAENDVMTFSMTPPLYGASCQNQNVLFNFPQTFDNPYPSSTGFSFSPNGNFNFTPNTIGTSLFGILVREYRNGILITETIRDGLINSIDCQTLEASINFNNWNNSNSHNLIIDRYEADCFGLSINSNTNITDIEITGLPAYVTYTNTNLGGTGVIIQVCPDYSEMPDVCEDFAFNFNVTVTAESPCSFYNGTVTSTDNYNLIVDGNDFCEKFEYYTNINPNTNVTTKIIPPITKVSDKIWVGDLMPGQYNPNDLGTVGNVVWTEDFVMIAGEEIILPNCADGTGDCVTLSSEFDADIWLKIQPNNCNNSCPEAFEFVVEEIFNCDNEHLEINILGDNPNPPYTATVQTDNGYLTSTFNNSQFSFNIHDLVYTQEEEVEYILSVHDAAGDLVIYNGQVLGTANFYKPLIETGVVWKDDFPPNSPYVDGWYYLGNHNLGFAQPFYLIDVHSYEGPYYGATYIEFKVWGRYDGAENTLVHQQIWDIEGNTDWSIDQGEINWNGHWNNDTSQGCIAGSVDVAEYMIYAENCSMQLNPISIEHGMNIDETKPPSNKHYEFSSINVLGCTPANDDFYGTIQESHSPLYTGDEYEAITNERYVSLNNSNLSIDSFSIYPNPTTGLFSIIGNLELITKITIYDVSGKVVYFNTVAPNKINIENFENGIYLVKLDTENESIYKKLIKQ